MALRKEHATHRSGSSHGDKKHAKEHVTDITNLRHDILTIHDKTYPESVDSFLHFIKIYRRHSKETRSMLLQDEDIINKISDKMIASFFDDKKKLQSNLADELHHRGLIEEQIKHIKAILLNDRVKARLQQQHLEISEQAVDQLFQPSNPSPSPTETSPLLQENPIGTINELADAEIEAIFKTMEVHIERLKPVQGNDALSQEIYTATVNLYNQCRTNIIALQNKPRKKDETDNDILASKDCKILKALDAVLIHVASPERSFEQKRKDIDTFRSTCKEIQPPAAIGKTIAAVAIVLGVTLACAVVGTLIGLAAGAWMGPGAAITAFKGAFAGGVFGWAEGIILAASITGITVGIGSWFAMFRDNKMQKLLNHVSTPLSKKVDQDERAARQASASH